MGATHLDGPLYVAGVPLNGASLPTTYGTTYFVDYDNGSDSWEGTMDRPFKTVACGYAAMTSNKDDVLAMSSVSAHAISDMLDVQKNRCHFVGLGGWGRYMGQRTRLEMGSTTGTAIAIVKNTGVGNTFSGIKFRSTDDLATSLYAFADGGEFTQISYCSFEKDEDLNQTTAAEFLCNADTPYYYHCSFGNCIYTVSVARAVVLFTGGTISGKKARDVIFDDCILMNKTSATTSVHVKATTADIERICEFNHTRFWTAKTSSATQAKVFGIASALTDGQILLRNCAVMNVTDVCSTGLGVFTTSPTPVKDGTEAVSVDTT